MIFLLDILIKNCPKLFSMGFYYTKDYITKKGSFIINIYLFYWFENSKKNIQNKDSITENASKRQLVMVEPILID